MAFETVSIAEMTSKTMTSIVPIHLRQILREKGTPIWDGYVNMLKILEGLFISPKHWVLEFLQNAEDAGAKTFSIHLKEDSLWILNNGKQFNDEDFHAICDVNSRKLPSLGLRGYLGIGFKSIFRITDRIDIHSGKFHFRFDKKYWQDLTKEYNTSLSKWPWEILPVDTGEITLPPGYTTGFHIFFSGDKGGKELQEMERFLDCEFPKEAILLLKNITHIQVQTLQKGFDIQKTITGLESLSLTKKQTVTVKINSTIASENEEIKYFMFLKNVPVPMDIQQDEETERVRRADIIEREVGLVFGLNVQEELQILSGRVAGVYSFLPVEGEQTGLPFGISGDLIPQPGRDLINYEARWNHWICNELMKLFKDVIYETFLKHPQWKFFPVELLKFVQYGSSSGPGKALWDVKLKAPIKEFLNTEAIYPDYDERMRRLNELFVAPAEVIQLIGKDKLEEITRKHLAHPFLKEKIGCEVEEINAWNLSNRKEFADFFRGKPEKLLDLPLDGSYDLLYSKDVLEPLRKEPERLASVYRHLISLNNYRIKGRQGRDPVPLPEIPFVLADDGEFYPPNEIIMVDLDITQAPEFLKGIVPVLDEKKRLHPEISKDLEAVQGLKKCGLEKIDRQKALSELQQLVEGIKTESLCPPDWKYPNDLIQAHLFLIANANEHLRGRLIAQDGTLQEPCHMFVAGTALNWGPLHKAHLLPGYSLVHECYFLPEWLDLYGLQRDNVLQHLQDMGVHGFRQDNDIPLIQDAAMAIARKRLSQEGHEIADVSQKDKLGYDLLCQNHCSKVFEVKGMSEPHDISLEPSEFSSAQQKKEDYILICVYGLPALPDIFIYKAIPDPCRICKPIEKARIPRGDWLGI